VDDKFIGNEFVQLCCPVGVKYKDILHTNTHRVHKIVRTSNVPDIAFAYTPSMEINNFERPEDGPEGVRHTTCRVIPATGLSA